MKSKAYCFSNASDYDIEDISEEVTFAETAGKAKQDFSIENGIHYKDIRVQLCCTSAVVSATDLARGVRIRRRNAGRGREDNANRIC